MMGSVLVQPQRVRRSQTADPAGLLISEIANLSTRLATDSEQGGRVAALMGEAAEQAVREFLQERVTAAQAAGPRISDWFLRVLRALTGITPEFRAGSVADGIELVRTVLDRVAANLEVGTGARIRPYVAELLDIVQNEFGLSLPAVENMFWEVVDDIINRLEAEPAETNRVARENRLDTIRILRRIKRLLRGKFALPVIDADRVTDAIVAQLRRVKIDALAQRINCVSNGVGAVSDATRAMEDLVPLSVSAFSTVGAAAAATPQNELYLWYPSWLYEKPVVINAERTEIRRGDDVIASGSNLTIKDLPDFKETTTPHYTFTPFDIETMETTAFVAYVLADALNAILHATSIEEGDISSNAANTLWNLFLTGSKITEKRPVLEDTYEEWVIPGLMSFALGWEGIHTNVNCKNFLAMWITLFGPDVLETFIYRTASTILRDAALSGMTLINYRGEFQAGSGPDNRPLNRKHVKGIISLPGILIDKAVFASFPREEYAQPGSHDDGGVKFLVFWGVVISTLFAVFNKFAGYLLAMGLGRSVDAGVLWDNFRGKIPFTDTKVPLLAIPPAWILWFISLYMAVEGDTDDGKYNPSGLPFDEYPKHDQSPYTLPYRSTAPAVYVGQANQGVFSHNFLNVEQTYAYDFSMDAEAIILASRSGTVVDYFDWVPDNLDPDNTEQAAAAADAAASGLLVPGQTNSDNWNFIAIRHDLDDAGATIGPDPVHDKGPGGTPVTTYAIYGHGRKDSVREMFAARGILPGAIIGSPVRRGQRIMRAGDTGISFHNHLHMMIQAGPTPAADPPPVARSRFTRGTIPFVFKDVTHLFSRDGVCKNLNFYSSETEDLL